MIKQQKYEKIIEDIRETIKTLGYTERFLDKLYSTVKLFIKYNEKLGKHCYSIEINFSKSALSIFHKSKEETTKIIDNIFRSVDTDHCFSMAKEQASDNTIIYHETENIA